MKRMQQLSQVAQQLLDRKIPASECLRLFRMQLIQAALQRTKGNQCAAARLLGLHRNNVRYWIWEMDLKANVHVRNRK